MFVVYNIYVYLHTCIIKVYIYIFCIYQICMFFGAIPDAGGMIARARHIYTNFIVYTTNMYIHIHKYAFMHILRVLNTCVL